MRTLLIFISGAILFLAGCESQQFEFVGTINTEKTYVVDNSGTFNESAQVSLVEILDSLDLPEDAIIGDVNFESLAIYVELLDGNAATSVSVNGSVDIDGDDLNLFNNFVVSAADAGSWISLTGLANDGVAAVKEKLQQYVTGTSATPFTVWTSGSSSPSAGSRVHANITIQIKCTVKYYQEADVPWFIHGTE